MWKACTLSASYSASASSCRPTKESGRFLLSEMLIYTCQYLMEMQELSIEVLLLRGGMKTYFIRMATDQLSQGEMEWRWRRKEQNPAPVRAKEWEHFVFFSHMLHPISTGWSGSVSDCLAAQRSYNGSSLGRAGIQTASTAFDGVSCHDVSLHLGSSSPGTSLVPHNSFAERKKKKYREAKALYSPSSPPPLPPPPACWLSAG